VRYGSPYTKIRTLPVAQQARHAVAPEALLPAPHTGLRNAGAAHDLRRAAPLRCRQDNPGPPDMLLRAVAIPHHRGQSLAVCGTHFDADSPTYEASWHTIRSVGILCLRLTTGCYMPPMFRANSTWSPPRRSRFAHGHFWNGHEACARPPARRNIGHKLATKPRVVLQGRAGAIASPSSNQAPRSARADAASIGCRVMPKAL
jgi:hypothetical protein